MARNSVTGSSVTHTQPCHTHTHSNVEIQPRQIQPYHAHTHTQLCHAQLSHAQFQSRTHTHKHRQLTSIMPAHVGNSHSLHTILTDLPPPPSSSWLSHALTCWEKLCELSGPSRRERPVEVSWALGGCTPAFPRAFAAAYGWGFGQSQSPTPCRRSLSYARRLADLQA